MTDKTQNIRITELPTRYEPLINTFGDKAKMTFVTPTDDINEVKRFMAAANSSGQGKLLFVKAESGAGKSTFVHSLEIFLSDQVDHIARLPEPHVLKVIDIPGYLAQLPITKKFTIVNFDGREAPYFDEREYRTFLGALNGILRNRKDLLIIWPVTDGQFSEKIKALLETVGGRSAFGPKALHELVGLKRSQYQLVLGKILQIANWRLEDAAIEPHEIEHLISQHGSIGTFLDSLQHLIAERFNIGQYGVEFPTLVIVISSGNQKIRETCRSLRRADSFYIEASRLMMYTKRSNAAEWWSNRSTNLKSALPHVIALFNAQLVSLSASSVIHSVLQYGDQELKTLVSGVRSDRGNAKRVVSSSELFKFATGGVTDNREYGSNVKDETFESYRKIQEVSETKHKAINVAIIDMVKDAGANLTDLRYEKALMPGLLTDAVYKKTPEMTIALEFHHKSEGDSTANKVAIYILEKLKEYAINFNLSAR